MLFVNVLFSIPFRFVLFRLCKAMVFSFFSAFGVGYVPCLAMQYSTPFKKLLFWSRLEKMRFSQGGVQRTL